MIVYVATTSGGMSVAMVVISTPRSVTTLNGVASSGYCGHGLS